MIDVVTGELVLQKVKTFPKVKKVAAVLEVPKVVPVKKTNLEIFLEKLHEVGKSWYGDNYRVSSRSNEVALYILYPEKKITNGKRTHTMYDLIIKVTFPYNEAKLIFSSLRGSRLTITPEELQSSYGFSHMQTINNAGFCYGSGPINGVIRKLTSVVDWLKTPNFDALEQLFFVLESYLAWESLEGGPYKKIQDIGSRTQVHTSFSQNQIDTIYHVTTKMIKEDPSLLILGRSSGKIKVTMTAIEDKILNSKPLGNYVINVNERGEEIEQSQSTSGTPGYMVEYGDERLYARWKKSDTQEVGRKVVSPIIINYLRNQLEQLINTKLYSNEL